MSGARVALVLMGIAMLSKIAGFMREVLLAHFYGASETSDAYLTALLIPGVLFSFVGVALSVAFIPTYVGLPKGERVGFVRSLTSLVLIASTLIVVLTLVFAEQFVSVVAPGFSESAASLAVRFTRIFVLGVYLTALINIFSGILRSEGRLVVPATAGLAFSVVVALSIIYSYYYGVEYLILGPLLAKLVEVVVMWPYVKRLGISLKPRPHMWGPAVKAVVLMTLPLTLGIAANEINVVISRALASRTGPGGVSALAYAFQINQLVVGVIALSLATIIFPKVSAFFRDADESGAARVLGVAIRSTIFLVVPAAVYAFSFGYEIVDVVYGRGQFDESAVSVTGGALLFYSVGMLGFALREILVRGFYAMKDARTPVYNATVGVIINIVLSFALVQKLGVAGLALAAAIAACVTTSLLLLGLTRRLGEAVVRGAFRELSLTLLGAATSALVAKVARPLFVFDEWVAASLLQSTVVFALVFLLVSWLAGADTFRGLLVQVKSDFALRFRA